MARTGRPRRDTRKITLTLDVDAADLLDQLASAENKRSRYVSELLRRAGVEAGLIAPGEASPESLDLAVLKQQLTSFEARYQDLQRRVDAALAQRQQR